MNVTTIMLGAAALGAILAVIIGQVRKHSGTRSGRGARRSHIFSASVTLMIAVCAFAEAALGHGDRYVLLGIGIVLVVTSATVMFNVRKNTTRV